ncbi:MAG: hypothetical protein FWE10_06615 [Rikenellaceae bacterium]|nr:hypothetical protein [Rikenellaceae bacterium]MCL2692489.1 hypothetical protein [Rikenellaceae bacterium]
MNRLYSFFIAAALLLGGCYADDSTGAYKTVESIEITGVPRDTINFYLGDEIRITPQIAGSGLTYQWGMGRYTTNPNNGEITTIFEEISTEKDLVHKTAGLGHYYLRQVVAGNEVSVIKYYHVFVNSEFEEGHFVLGRREDGTASIAFMKTLTPEEEEQGLQPRFRQDLFEYVNGYRMGVDPIICHKVHNSLFIACGESQRVYQIDAKSFQLQFMYDYSRYAADFVPLNLMAFDGEYCLNLVSTSANGGIARIQWNGLDIFPFTELRSQVIFDRVAYRQDGLVNCRMCFINSAQGIIYAYGFDMNNPPNWYSYMPCYDHFVGRQILHAFQDAQLNLIVYSKQGDTYLRTRVGSFITSFVTFNSLDIIFELPCMVNTHLLTMDTPSVHNDLWNCLIFADGNKIYRWYYNQSDLPDAQYITLADGETVTALGLSADQRQLFVGSYNPSRQGHKGSYHVFNSDTGARIGQSHEGVSDRPVTVMYKVR